jgi:hypothetical protein
MDDNQLIDKVRENAEKISSSDIFATIVTKNFLDDPYCAMQLGLAIF